MTGGHFVHGAQHAVALGRVHLPRVEQKPVSQVVCAGTQHACGDGGGAVCRWLSFRDHHARRDLSLSPPCQLLKHPFPIVLPALPVAALIHICLPSVDDAQLDALLPLHPAPPLSLLASIRLSGQQPGSMGLDDAGAIGIGVVVGILSTSVQSLGLTLQRKSHLLEDDRPAHVGKRPPHRRRRWQVRLVPRFAEFKSHVG